MEIISVKEFVTYYEKIRKRSSRVIACIPPDKIEWAYREGKFSLGDLVRHIAAIERFMYAENAQFKPSRYAGCGVELAEGYDDIMQFFDRMHQESLAIFSALTMEEMQQILPGIWWLQRAMQ